MGIIARQSTYTTVIFAVGIALGYLNMVVLFPHFMPEAQFGLVRVLIAFALIFIQFAGLGLPYTIVRFFPDFKDPERGHKGLLTLGLLVALIGFAVVALLFLAFKGTILGIYSENAPLFTRYHLWVLPIAFSLLIFEILEYYSRAHLQITFPNLAREVLLRLFTMGSLLAFAAGWINFNGFLLLFSFGYASQVILLLGFLYKQGNLYLKRDFSFLSANRLRTIGTYAGFSMLTTGSSLVLINIDTIMIGSLVGLEAVALYTVAFFIGSVIMIPQRAIGQISMGIASEAWAANDMDKLGRLYKNSAKHQLLIGGWFFVMIWANTANLFTFLPANYGDGTYVILFIALGKLVATFTGINNEILITSGRYRFNLYAMLALIALTIATNFWLIPLYGITGAALATALSVTLFNLTKLVFIHAVYKLHPLTLELGITAALVLILGIGVTFLPTLFTPWIDIIVKCVAITMLFAAFAWVFRISPEGMDMVRTILGRVRKGF